jgi:hypothetical protein
MLNKLVGHPYQVLGGTQQSTRLINEPITTLEANGQSTTVMYSASCWWMKQNCVSVLKYLLDEIKLAIYSTVITP